MAVYVVNAYNIHDWETFSQYPPHVRVLFGRYGAKVVAMQTNPDALEGVSKTMNAIIEFPSREAVNSFYNDPDYQKIIHLRKESTSDCTMIIMDEFIPAK